ncbi:MAG: hypothetical protein GXY42_03305 [Desulfovibrionales bacterium]|nr:hypothetical protein [Desulfovibrionales bacterium]
MSGKSTFLARLATLLEAHTILLPFSGALSLSKHLSAHLSPQKQHKSNLSKRLQEHRRVVLLVDNAHLLQDSDFAFLHGLFTLAKQLHTVLQIVLMGNREIVHRLARPDNRTIHSMIGTIWNMPKLTREQSLSYINFLLDSAGLAADLIPYPEVLVEQAAGSIGVLRRLTAAKTKNAMDEPAEDDAAGNMVNQEDHEPSPAPAMPQGGETPAQTVVKTPPSRVGWILLLTMAGFIALFLLAFAWLLPETGIKDFLLGADSAPRATVNDAELSTPQAIIQPPGSLPNVAKTVFRKRTQDGPYSLQLGSYASIEALVLHLPRFADLGQPLFWTREEGPPVQFVLFAGRFDEFNQASQFGVHKKMAEATVVFRPFVATAGPLTDAQQIRNASFLVGLPGIHDVFERELVSGVEVQFALERTREEALARCSEAEAKGLSCAVTQYE